MSRFPVLVALSALLGIASLPEALACDRITSGRCSPGIGEVSLVDRTNGQELPLYRHDGQLWAAGIPGHRYAIRIRNASGARVLGVVAVDGVNAVSGATAAWNQTGYVLEGGQGFDVLGWRKSQERVADFVFADIEESYAARTGRPRDVGVIGVAFFRERVPMPPPVPALSDFNKKTVPSASDSPAPTAAPAQRDEGEAKARRAEATGRLGTGHGPGETSWVGTTDFERAQDTPDLVVSIRYERPERLVSMGILPGATSPRPFPDSASAGFVPDPPPRRW